MPYQKIINLLIKLEKNYDELQYHKEKQNDFLNMKNDHFKEILMNINTIKVNYEKYSIKFSKEVHKL